MGSCTFVNIAAGANASDTFDVLVKQAYDDYQAENIGKGHIYGEDYAGDISDKESFNMAALPAGLDVTDKTALNKAIWDATMPLDKWGPAGCFDLGIDPSDPSGKNHLYAFFGWAPE